MQTAIEWLRNEVLGSSSRCRFRNLDVDRLDELSMEIAFFESALATERAARTKAEAEAVRIDEENGQLKAKLDTERAAREEAERLAVWAVQKRARMSSVGSAGLLEWSTDFGQCVTCCDGTDAGILAVLRRAMKGEG